MMFVSFVNSCLVCTPFFLFIQERAKCYSSLKQLFCIVETLEFEQIKIKENLQASRMNNINLVPVSSAKNTKSKRNLSDDLEDSLLIPHNLSVTFINGENLTAFLHSLCMINKVCYIPGTVKIREV